MNYKLATYFTSINYRIRLAVSWNPIAYSVFQTHFVINSTILVPCTLLLVSKTIMVLTTIVLRQRSHDIMWGNDV